MRFVLATANPAKGREIADVLAAAELGVELTPRPPEIPAVHEIGVTLEDNARLKARAVRDATGEPAIADDTGLEVDALDGAPGVQTARFAGPEARDEENVALLLERLRGVPLERRRARFVTVAVASFPDGRSWPRSGARRAPSPASGAARAGSGTTRCSSPTPGTGGRSRS